MEKAISGRHVLYCVYTIEYCATSVLWMVDGSSRSSRASSRGIRIVNFMHANAMLAPSLLHNEHLTTCSQAPIASLEATYEKGRAFTIPSK